MLFYLLRVTRTQAFISRQQIAPVVSMPCWRVFFSHLLTTTLIGQTASRGTNIAGSLSKEKDGSGRTNAFVRFYHLIFLDISDNMCSK